MGILPKVKITFVIKCITFYKTAFSLWVITHIRCITTGGDGCSTPMPGWRCRSNDRSRRKTSVNNSFHCTTLNLPPFNSSISITVLFVSIPITPPLNSGSSLKPSLSPMILCLLSCFMRLLRLEQNCPDEMRCRLFLVSLDALMALSVTLATAAIAGDFGESGDERQRRWVDLKRGRAAMRFTREGRYLPILGKGHRRKIRKGTEKIIKYA